MHSIIKGDLEAVVSAVPNYLSYNPNNWKFFFQFDPGIFVCS
jgi:hypothetical protein